MDLLNIIKKITKKINLKIDLLRVDYNSHSKSDNYNDFFTLKNLGNYV